MWVNRTTAASIALSSSLVLGGLSFFDDPDADCCLHTLSELAETNAGSRLICDQNGEVRGIFISCDGCGMDVDAAQGVAFSSLLGQAASEQMMLMATAQFSTMPGVPFVHGQFRPIERNFTDTMGISITIKNGTIDVSSNDAVNQGQCVIRSGSLVRLLDESGAELGQLDFSDDESLLNLLTIVNEEIDVQTETRTPSMADLFDPEKAPGRKAHLGITLGTVDSSLGAHLGVDADEVMLITSVKDGLPADRAGIRAFDIITHIDGQTPATAERLRTILDGKSIGDRMTVHVVRAGECCREVELSFQSDDFLAVAAAPSQETWLSFSPDASGFLISEADVRQIESMMYRPQGAQAEEGREDEPGVSPQRIREKTLDRLDAALESQLKNIEWQVMLTEKNEDGKTQRTLIVPQPRMLNGVADFHFPATAQMKRGGPISMDPVERRINELDQRMRRMEAMLEELLRRDP